MKKKKIASLIIFGILIILIGLIIYSSYNFSQMKYNETKNLVSTVSFNDNHIIKEQDIINLPKPIQKWLLSSGVIGREEIKLTYVKQEALMKLKPDQKKWYPANAIQYITTQKPAFIWTVEMSMMPLITIKGRDKSFEGKGEMLIKANSFINIVNEDGIKIDEGSLQRYLAEMVWSPSSVISPYIEWEEIDSLTAKAIINYKGTVASGTFHFNGKGDFIKFTTMRYKDNVPKSKRYPWVITVQEYKTFEGIRVPSKTKITWELDKKDWTWLILEIKDIKYNNNAKKIFNNYFQNKK